MKMLKKFFALALATVTLVAAVYYVTPAMKAMAEARYDVEWADAEQTIPSKVIRNDTSGKYVFNGSTYVVYKEETKTNPVDPKAPTPEKQAAQEQTPASIAAYEQWLATWGGGTAAAAGTTTQNIAGTIGQAGSEVVVSGGTPNGQPVAMFQSNDASNTLVAGAVGAIPTGTKITSAVAAEGSASYTAAKAALGKKDLAFTYDITATAAPTAQFAMSIPVPADLKIPAGKSLKVYAIVDGKATLLDCGIKDGRIVFGTAAFGTFAFVIE